MGGAQIKWKDNCCFYAIQTRVPGNASGRHEQTKPAFFAQGDDVLENVDEQTLETEMPTYNA